jgi:hypothetical protein
MPCKRSSLALREPRPAALGDDHDGLPDADVFTDLGDDNGDDAVGRRPQQGLFEMPLEHLKGCRRCLHLRVGDGALLAGRAGHGGGMVGLGLGDIGTRGRHVVLGLVERLPGGDVAARQDGRSCELHVRVFAPRFRLGDLRREGCELLVAHTGIDVVALRGRGHKRRARLPHGRGQLDRRQLRDDVAGTNMRPLLDLDRGELSGDLGRDADLGCAHDADDPRRRLAARDKISAGARGDEDEADGNDASEPVASHARASA